MGLDPSTMLHENYDTDGSMRAYATSSIQRLQFSVAWHLPKKFRNTGYPTVVEINQVSGDLYFGISDCTVTQQSSLIDRYTGWFKRYFDQKAFCLEGNNGQEDFMLNYFR